nr:NAD(P)/FAD-dependent oxidoreductase [uncultured Capnocytophaga sp.]
MYDLLVVGGGAAGFFAAINTAEKHPDFKIAILEKSKEVLHKVRISGGGRCNLTNATFTPAELVGNYPRGKRELLSPFSRFMCGDVMEWFEARGVALKTEADGRVFPASNTSESIVNCFLSAVQKHSIQLFVKQNVEKIAQEGEGWAVSTPEKTYTARYLLMATGSNPKMWQLLSALGHSIVPPVPSLFTFQTDCQWAKELSGVAVKATVRLLSTEGAPLKISETGALLFTHTGVSGPAVLRASAWGARLLAEQGYQCLMEVNFTPNGGEMLSYEESLPILQEFKQHNGRKAVQGSALWELPKRLWGALIGEAGISGQQLWADLSKTQLQAIAKALTQYPFRIGGKATFKDEFVTAGGVKLQEVNFKTFESKLFPHLYFAGEILDIDAITGGFNFQNAWTGAYIVSESIGN